jgi:3-oxoacyl-(acyl-carrier-protein) synthase
MSVPAVGKPPAEPQTLDEVLDWHGGIIDALAEQSASVRNAIRTGSAVAARFVGMTERDIDSHYDMQRRELDRLTILNLVASAEATIKSTTSAEWMESSRTSSRWHIGSGTRSFQRRSNVAQTSTREESLTS